MKNDVTSDVAKALLDQLNEVVIGQEAVIREVVTCLFAGGHVLIEGVPGLGKTLLVKTLAASFGGDAARIQFTPDLMPADVTGHTVFDSTASRFEIRKGPVFTNLLLADEINRAPAKTQAALLEVMQEGQVTIEGEGYAVADPFMVLATQNPIEQDGTYPLPEAELDRFMMKVRIDYPEQSAEETLVRMQTDGRTSGRLDVSGVMSVLSAGDVVTLKRRAAEMLVDDAVLAYAVAIVRATREAVGLSYGASPRASIALVAASKAMAMIGARDFVLPDDVKAAAPPVLRHRVQLSPDREIEGVAVDDALAELLDGVEAPRQ